MAPQGFLASGDGYSRRYDEIIADVERKTKCVDDTAMWDDDLEIHWWRVIDFLELCGRNGIILNLYLRAFLEFPTPKTTKDIRAWFGLVHQVSHYNKLTDMMKPFKPFLSPKVKFQWNDELNGVFESSKNRDC